MGGVLILMDVRGRKHRVSLKEDMVRVRGIGAFDASNLVANVGRRIDVGGKRFLVLEPSARDLLETMERAAQTLTPKDIAVLVFETGIRSGLRVVEAGAGSGGLTVALARAVGASGRVFTYDVRDEFLRVARANVESADVASTVEFKLGDVRQHIEERAVDAFVLDLKDPWSAVPAAWDALRPCGHFASFSPNMEQIKETVAAIRKHPFVDVRTIEIIEREMEVRDVGVRPSFAALGHTGYLTFARKVLEAF